MMTKGWQLTLPWGLDFGLTDKYRDELEISSRKYSWHKQELFKGRGSNLRLGGQETAPYSESTDSMLSGLCSTMCNYPEEFLLTGCTSTAGWGKHQFMIRKAHHSRDVTIPEERAEISSEDANKMTNEELKNFDKVVFRHSPRFMNKNALSEEEINYLLAYAIPALSKPMGVENLNKENLKEFDLASLKSKSWPRNKIDALKNIWSHSDFVLVPYFYNFKFYEKIKEIITQ